MNKNAQLNSSAATIDAYLVPADIHDLARAPRGGALTLIVAVLATAAEAWIAYRLFWEGAPLSGALWLHGFVVFLLCAYAFIARTFQSEARFAALLALTTAFAGLYGAAGSTLALLLSWLYAPLSHSFREWYESIFPRLAATDPQRVYDDLRTGRDESEKLYRVIPFLDVLSFGREEEKRRALAKIASSFHPAFAPVLKKALSDPSNTIRVQAATAIGKVEAQFTRRQMELSRVLADHPNDPVVLLAVARHYDDYAYTGLLDGNREAANRRSAMGYYRQYLEKDPAHVESRAAIGRLMMRGAEYGPAVDWFRQCIDLGYSTPSMWHWYAEALFALGRFAELRRYAPGIPAVSQDRENVQPALAQAIRLWTEQGSRA